MLVLFTFSSSVTFVWQNTPVILLACMSYLGDIQWSNPHRSAYFSSSTNFSQLHWFKVGSYLNFYHPIYVISWAWNLDTDEVLYRSLDEI
jgi:hypothetical protein